MSKINKEKCEEICEYYKKHIVSVKECADVVGVGQHTVSKILKNASIPFRSEAEIRRRHINEEFFDTIDSELKAYLLGFLMADGYVRYIKIGKDNYKREAIVCLESVDKYIVDLLNSVLSTKNNVRERARVINNKVHHIFTLRISSTKLVDKLCEYGIVPNKTGKEVLPENIPEQFKKDFIRGFIDGDGTLGVYDAHSRLSMVSSSSRILNSINSYFIDLFNVKNKKLYASKRDSNCYYLQYCDKHSLVNILQFLYNSAQYYLPRKKIKADHILTFLQANTEES